MTNKAFQLVLVIVDKFYKKAYFCIAENEKKAQKERKRIANPKNKIWNALKKTLQSSLYKCAPVE